MDDSILTTIKKLLGLSEEMTQFDTDIILHINANLITLNQIGVGPSEGYIITDSSDTWGDFIEGNNALYEPVKAYIYLRVRMIFDPPTNSFVFDAMKNQAAEYEWRLRLIADQEKE